MRGAALQVSQVLRDSPRGAGDARQGSRANAKSIIMFTITCYFDNIVLKMFANDTSLNTD